MLINGCIYQEVLQGARDATNFERLNEYFGNLPFCPAPEPASHQQAARLFARLRWQGVTIRSANDCLIAQQAVDHGLWLIHDDADFEKLQAIEPRLKLG